jgi:putative copper resistance protein D
MIDPLILVRAVHFSATALAAGTVSFRVLAAGRGPPTGVNAFEHASRWLVWGGLLVAATSGAIWLIWLASDIYGAPLVNVCLHGGAWSVLNGTRFGEVWIARLALALVLAGLLSFPATRWLQLAIAAALIGSMALIGHAGATPYGAGRLHLVSDTAHLLAAAAWVGGLPALALLLHQTRREPRLVAAAVRRFSIIGVVSVGTLIASGFINSWNLLAGPRDLIVTDYGRLLLLKIAMFAAMLGIATVNRYQLTPQLGARGTSRSLARNSLVETGLGLCVFFFVGALGTMAPPRHDHVHIPNQQIPADAAFVHIHSEEAMADVTIQPGRVGAASVAVLLMREDFSIFTAKEVRLLLTPQAPGMVAPISRTMVREPDGGWRVKGLDVVQSGVWTVRLAVETSDGKEIVLDAPVVIEP